MTASLSQLKAWMTAAESEKLEFKEARQSYSFEKLLRYCAALANEGGGRFILGVTDKAPRQVVGTAAFQNLGDTTHRLLQQLHLRIHADELAHADGRVLVFTVPARPVGMPIAVDGRYWMRAGESLTVMTPDLLKRIFDEAAPDFSAETCDGATLADLDPGAVDTFRQAWQRKSGNPQLETLSTEQSLSDSELLIDGRVTYAALALLGTYKSLGRTRASSSGSSGGSSSFRGSSSHSWARRASTPGRRGWTGRPTGCCC